MLNWLRKVRKALGIIRTRPIKVNGRFRFNGKIGSAIFIGKSVHVNYLQSLLFEEVIEFDLLPNIYFWQIHQLVKRNRFQVELSFISGTQQTVACYQTTKYPQFFIPNWLVGIGSTDFSHLSRSARSDLTRIAKAGLWFQFSNEASQAKHFYDQMYLPYIRNRHKQAAIEMSWSALAEKMKIGMIDILYVYHDSLAIAGLVIDYSGGIAKFWSVGVLNNDRQWLNLGAAAACYYFAGKWLASKGIRHFDFGLTRPFIEDGVYFFKAKWGNQLLTAPGDGFLLSNYLSPEHAESFYQNFPFIQQRDQSLSIVASEAIPQKQRMKLAETGLEVQALQSQQSTVELAAPPKITGNEKHALAAAICFIQLACLGQQSNSILFYHDDSLDEALKHALVKACQQQGLSQHWIGFSETQPTPQIESQLIQTFTSYTPNVVVELSNQYFYPSPVWQHIRQQGSKVIALGRLNITEFIYSYYHYSPALISIFEQQLMAKLAAANRVTIRCKNGTDVTMNMQRRLTDIVLAKLKLRPWQSSHVRASKGMLTAYSRDAFLHGQVSFAGVANSINGRLVTNEYIWPPKSLGQLTCSVTANIRQGQVVSFDGDPAIVEQLETYSSVNNRQIKHFCLGLLPFAHFGNGIMLAERKLGAVNLGFGDYPAHCDWITSHASVWLDDKLLIEDGHFVDKGISSIALQINRMSNLID